MARFVLTGFGDEISPVLSRQLAVMSQLGFRYIEPRTVDGKNISDLTNAEAKTMRLTLDDFGFNVSALGSPVGKVDIREDFGPHYAKFMNTLDVCTILNCNAIRIFSFFIPEDEDPARYRDEVMAHLRTMLIGAKKRGIMLMHENEKGIYGDITARCVDLMNELRGEGLHFTFDPSNFVQCGCDTLDAFERLKGDIAYMHMKDSVSTAGAKRELGPDAQHASHDAHRPVGFGESNIEEILRRLNAMDYSGYLSVEPHLQSCALVPGNPRQKFAAATRALQDLLMKLDLDWA